MNIGAAAQASGISAKMIRHYEALGLLAAAKRSAAGYRHYTEADIHVLQFIRRARDLGFSLAQIQNLLSLWHDKQRPSKQVKDLASQHLHELEQKLAEILSMKATLEHLLATCHGDQRPDCPILAELSGQTTWLADLSSCCHNSPPLDAN